MRSEIETGVGAQDRKWSRGFVVVDRTAALRELGRSTALRHVGFGPVLRKCNQRSHHCIWSCECLHGWTTRERDSRRFVKLVDLGFHL